MCHDKVFSLLLIFYRDRVLECRDKVSVSGSATLLQHSLLCCNNLFVDFLNLFRDNNFSIVTEVVIFAWICCHDRFLFPYTIETELCVTTDTKDVATYFLPLPLSLAELSIATLKSLSLQTCLGLSYCSSIFCHDKNFSLCIFYCRDINFGC